MSGALPAAASVVSVSNCMHGLACKADQAAWARKEQEGQAAWAQVAHKRWSATCRRLDFGKGNARLCSGWAGQLGERASALSRIGALGLRSEEGKG